MIFICFSHVERYIVAQSLSYHLKNYGYKICMAINTADSIY